MSLVVTLDGIDISARVLPTVTVVKEERKAAQARFIYVPTAAPQLPADMIRKQVIMSWAGNLIFIGRVNRAYWDPRNRNYRLECSDLLQEQFEGKTDAQILALIPGSTYSTAIFGDREDGWQFAQDLMSTVRKDVFLDRTGLLRVIDWKRKPTPDYTFTAAEVLNDGEYELDLAKARDLVTRLSLSYEYGYSRWKHRSHSFGWSYVNPIWDPGGGSVNISDWCAWAQNGGYDMPTREVVRSAAEGTGWAISGSILFKTHPVTGSYCGGLVNWVITDEAQSQVAIEASWSGVREWAQSIKERYEITLDVTVRQAEFGIVVHEDAAARQIEADDGAFEAGATIGGGWPADGIGDRNQDQDDEVARIADLTTLMNIAITYAWSTYRSNSVSFDIPIDPTVDLEHTGRLNTPDIDTSGKVRRVEHTITLERATTRLGLAISNGGGGTFAQPPVPDRPDTQPGHAAPPGSTSLSTYVGGCGSSAVYDPNWLGWSTNMPGTICTGGTPQPDQIYPNRFRVKGPDIENESRDEREGVRQVTHTIAVPQDPLTLT